MKPINFLIPLVFLLILVSCSKDHWDDVNQVTMTISGYATNVATGDSMPNVKLRLRADSRGGSSALSNFEKILDSTYTDQSGYYQFTLKCSPDAYVGHPQSFSYGVEYTGKYLYSYPGKNLSTFTCSNENRSVNVTVIPLTWIKVHIKNQAPASSSDSIYYNGPVDQNSFPNPPISQFSLEGSKIDSIFYVTIKAGKSPLFYWDITKNGITTRSAAYQGCASKDTCTLQIFF